MEDDPLIVCGDGGVNDSAPDPLFLKAINQPVERVATDGNVMLPSPPSQLYVEARLALVIVGATDMSITFCVVAN
jgi:hypothetical protein